MKFLVLFKSNKEAKERIAQASREDVQESMERWSVWREEAIKTVQFEWGLPLRLAAHITKDEVGMCETEVTGHATMEGDKDAVVKALQSHPHIQNPGCSIDLMEMIPLEDM